MIRKYAVKISKGFLSITNPLYFNAILHGVAPGIEHTNLLKQYNFRTIIDIGANRGQFALVARRLFPAAQIISFEPLSIPAKQFNLLFRNDPRVKLYQAAIGNKKGSEIIHVSAADDSSSLLPISNVQEQLFPGTAETGKETVKLYRLADLVTVKEIMPTALLKLDVQGYELQALKGCEDLLYYFTFIYAECSFVELYEGQALADEIIAWLRQYSFILKGVYNLSYDLKGNAIQGDFLFSKKSIS